MIWDSCGVTVILQCPAYVFPNTQCRRSGISSLVGALNSNSSEEKGKIRQGEGRGLHLNHQVYVHFAPPSGLEGVNGARSVLEVYEARLMALQLGRSNEAQRSATDPAVVFHHPTADNGV